MKYNQLGQTPFKISAVGYGASAIGGVYGEVDIDQAIQSVHSAFELGINYYDTSPYYGLTKSETVLGKAIKDLPRDELVISTKLGRYGADEFDFSAKRVASSVEQSMQRLGVEVIDILNCHDIEFVKLDQIINETLPAMLALQKQGKVRTLGITGLPLEIFDRVIDQVQPGIIQSVLSYCHGSINDTTLLDKIDYFKTKKIGVVNASPTSMALLAPNGPRDWHPAGEKVRAVCMQTAKNCADAGINIVKLAIQYATQLQGIDACLLGVGTKQRVINSLAWHEEPIDQDQLKQVQQWLAPIANISWQSGLPENNTQVPTEAQVK